MGNRIMENDTNIHKLPQCPKCSGPMKLGVSMGGPKIYCKEYHTCGGIIHNPNAQQQDAIAISDGHAAEGIAVAMRRGMFQETVETSAPQVLTCLSSSGEFIFIRVYQFDPKDAMTVGIIDKKNRIYHKRNIYNPNEMYGDKNNVMFKPFNRKARRYIENHSIGISQVVLDVLSGLVDTVEIDLTTVKDGEKTQSVLRGELEQWTKSDNYYKFSEKQTSSEHPEMNRLVNDIQEMAPIENLTEVKL